MSSFYYHKRHNFTAENILISYGQPKVGSETFSREFTDIMNNQIYRIARPNDIGTLFPNKYSDLYNLFHDFIQQDYSIDEKRQLLSSREDANLIDLFSLFNFKGNRIYYKRR